MAWVLLGSTAYNLLNWLELWVTVRGQKWGNIGNRLILGRNDQWSINMLLLGHGWVATDPMRVDLLLLW